MRKGTFCKLREQERLFRKNSILDAVIKVSKKKDFYQTSMSEIAMELGISTTSIYRYFPSQRILFFEAFIRDFSKLDPIIKEILEKPDSGEKNNRALDDLADVIVNYLLTSEAAYQMLGLLVTDRNIPDQFMEKFYCLRDKLNKRIIGVLKRSGIKKPDVNAPRVFLSSVIGAVLAFKNYPEKNMANPEESIKELTRFTVTVVKSGLLSLKEQPCGNFEVRLA